MFGFVAKQRGIWPVSWMCDALGVSRSGFHAWLTRSRSDRSIRDEELSAAIRASFLRSDRTYGARRVWHDLLEEGYSCGLHCVERLMRQAAFRARPKRRQPPKDEGTRSIIAANVLERECDANGPNQKWVADFTYVWTAEGWLYVAVVIDLFSRRVVGWSMSDQMGFGYLAISVTFEKCADVFNLPNRSAWTKFLWLWKAPFFHTLPPCRL